MDNQKETVPYVYGMPLGVFQHLAIEIDLEEAIEASSDKKEIKVLKKALKDHLKMKRNWDYKTQPVVLH